ncbi:MAG: hypothetical protein WKG07_15165 [Hymenobacter sp.]
MGLTFARAGQGTLRVWRPTAAALRLRLYAAGAGGAAVATHAMQRGPGWHLACWRCRPAPPASTPCRPLSRGRELAEVRQRLPTARAPWA